MEYDEKEEVTAPFMPVIPRLDRLDRLLKLLEQKHSLSRRELQFCAKSCAEELENSEHKTLSSAVEEVQHKGTLMERVAVLENRVLQLSLEMEEGNTSKSSSSTVQVCSEMTAKDSELSSVPPELEKNRVKDTSEEMQDTSVIKPREEDVSSSAEGKRSAQQQKISSGQRKKTQKKWRQRLFRLRLVCS